MVFPLEKVVQDSLEQTVSAPKGELDGLHLVQYLSYAGLNMYPWWSPARDRQLTTFWKSSDHLSGAIYTLESKISAIALKVKARDQTNKEAKTTDRISS